MAHIYGDPSKYIKRNKFIALFAAAIYGLLFLFICYVFFKNFSFHVNASDLIGLLFLLPLSWCVCQLAKKERRSARAFSNGERGEDTIYKQLEKLPDAFHVYRGIKFVHFGDVDAIILGPTGLFLLEIKSHAGEIDFDGTRLVRKSGKQFEKDFLRQTQRVTEKLSTRLKLHIKNEVSIVPVIVFSNYSTTMRFGLTPVNGIYVIQRKLLIPFILTHYPVLQERQKRPTRLAEEQIIHLKGKLDRLLPPEATKKDQKRPKLIEHLLR